MTFMEIISLNQNQNHFNENSCHRHIKKNALKGAVFYMKTFLHENTSLHFIKSTCKKRNKGVTKSVCAARDGHKFAFASGICADRHFRW